MNERILKLMEQAGLQPYYDAQEGQIEKFAELIVRECARVYWNIDDGETHTEYVEALKKHFGVAE